MWTEPLQNGKYKAVERYTDPITGKAKKVSITIDKDSRNARKEAQKRLDEKIEAILGKTDYDNMTFGDLCDRYVGSLAKPQSAKSYKTITKRLKKTLGEDAKVNAFTAFYVSEKLKDETTTKYNRSIRTLKTIIRFGYKNDFVNDMSWTDKLTLRKDNKAERIENKYLEPDELATLIASMDKYPHWKLLTKFLALSGLRIGEAFALNIQDVDTYIHVTKTIDTRNGEIEDTPKTADSNRDVYIQPELAQVISEIKKWRLQYAFSHGLRSDLLFPGLKYKAYYSILSTRQKNIPEKKLSPHTFRHTHASLLAAAGVSLEAISRRLGHSDSKVTKQVYLHVTEKLKEKEEEQLSKVKLL